MTPTPTPPRPNAQPPRPAQGPAVPAAVAIDPVKLFLRFKWLLLIAAVVGGVIGVGSHFVLLKVYPIFTSEVYFECLPPDLDPGVIRADKVDAEEIERFMGTQVDRMKSVQVLDRVIRDARLRGEAPDWTSDYYRGGNFDVVNALEDLEKIVKASMIPNTYLVRLAVATNAPQDSAGIVRLIKENYLEQLRTASTSDITARKEVLKQAIQSANRTLEDLNARRARLVREGEMDTLDGLRSQTSESLRLVNFELIKVQQGLEAAEVGLARDEAELQRNSGIQYDNTLRLEVDSAPEMLYIKQTLNQLESRLAALKQQGILPSHREYRILTSEIEGNRQQLEQTRERLLRDAFESRIDQYRLAIQQMNAQESDLLRQAEELSAKMTELTRVVGELSDIDRTIESTIKLIGENETSLTTLNATASLDSAARVRVVQSERIADVPSFPKIYIMGPLGMILISGLTLAVIVVLELLDQRIKGPSDVAALGRINVLGLIPDAGEDPAQPEHPESVFRDMPASVLSEHYRQTRNKVAKAMLKSGHRSLLVVGATPGSGATSVVSNMGSALVAAGHSVLVIDANYRRPRLHQAFDAPENPGLADVLSGNAELDQALSKRQGSPDLLPAGSARHRMVEQLGSQKMGDLLSAVRDRYEFILVDVAPALVAGDSQALANRCDASLLVVRAMQEKRGMVARLRTELSESRAEFLGAVVNAVRSAAGGYMRKNIRTSASYNTEAKADPA